MTSDRAGTIGTGPRATRNALLGPVGNSTAPRNVWITTPSSGVVARNRGLGRIVEPGTRLSAENYDTGET